MTTAVEESRGHLPEEVAERVRIALAARRVTQRTLCAALELSPPSVSKRVSGKHPFDLAEIEIVAKTAGVSVIWLLTGLDTTTSPNGGDESLLPDSNRRPSAYKVLTLTSEDHCDTGSLVPFPVRDRETDEPARRAA